MPKSGGKHPSAQTSQLWSKLRRSSDNFPDSSVSLHAIKQSQIQILGETVVKVDGGKRSAPPKVASRREAHPTPRAGPDPARGAGQAAGRLADLSWIQISSSLWCWALP